MSDPVVIERRAAIAVIRLNVPEKRNALTSALYPALARALETLPSDASVRAIVLTGGRHFCAGGDVDDLSGAGLDLRHAMQQSQRSVKAIVSATVPVIAAVEGAAFGAGFSLAMACDFVLADENTRFCAAFGRVGLAPDYGLLWSLPQRVGVARTRELIMLCDPIAGVEAHACGIADRLCAPGTVFESAMALAERLASAPPGTIAVTKMMLARHPQTLETLLAWEADAQALLLTSADFQEGVKAFQEKRPPRWEGR